MNFDALVRNIPPLFQRARGLKRRVVWIYAGIGGALILFLLAMLWPVSPGPERMKVFPSVMLWAPDRPEDLRFLRSKKIGVAYLAQTLTVCSNTVTRKARTETLQLPEGAALMAVTRVEIDHREPLWSNPSLIRTLVDDVLKEIHPGVRGVQLDFPVVLKDRPFFTALVVELRRRMNPSLPLSIQAQVSWTLDNDWIRDLPVDEAVPMCFGTGVDTRALQPQLAAHQDFLVPLAHFSMGMSLQEPLPWIPGSFLDPRRVYVYNDQSWTPASVQAALKASGH